MEVALVDALTSQLIFFLPLLSSLAHIALAFSESRASLRFHWVISFLSSSRLREPLGL